MSRETVNLFLKKELTREDIVTLLRSDDDNKNLLFKEASEVKKKYLGNTIYMRGLIEYSNLCGKNCLYCGVRKDNKKINRYTLSDDEVFGAAIAAREMGFGSITLQAGELDGQAHTDKIESLINTIRKLTDNALGITISMGEQSSEAYKRWFEAGADLYLLRIEASGKNLYERVHPDDGHHNYYIRHECLKMIQDTGYQTGVGIIVGLPHQTLYDLADDIIFMRDFDIDICGISPFIEHTDTPIGKGGSDTYFLDERFNLTLKMIAIMRIIMKDINIVSATAVRSIDPTGQEKAIRAGANIIMPNLTPIKYREGYKLYEPKPDAKEIDRNNVSGLNLELLPGETIGLGKWGDTAHFQRRKNKL